MALQTRLNAPSPSWNEIYQGNYLDKWTLKYQKVSPEVWVDGRLGRAKITLPIQVRLHSGAKILNLTQYPLKE